MVDPISYMYPASMKSTSSPIRSEGIEHTYNSSSLPVQSGVGGLGGQHMTSC